MSVTVCNCEPAISSWHMCPWDVETNPYLSQRRRFFAQHRELDELQLTLPGLVADSFRFAKKYGGLLACSHQFESEFGCIGVGANECFVVSIDP